MSYAKFHYGGNCARQQKRASKMVKLSKKFMKTRNINANQPLLK